MCGLHSSRRYQRGASSRLSWPTGTLGAEENIWSVGSFDRTTKSSRRCVRTGRVGSHRFRQHTLPGRAWSFADMDFVVLPTTEYRDSTPRCCSRRSQQKLEANQCCAGRWRLGRHDKTASKQGHRGIQPTYRERNQAGAEVVWKAIWVEGLLRLMWAFIHY